MSVSNLTSSITEGISSSLGSVTLGQMGGTLTGGVNRALGSNAHYFDQANNPKIDDIKNLLESRGDKEKLEGMKRIVALMSRGRDVSSLFPNVVKNVVAQNLEVKKLTYVYLTHYAELEPETALLSINTFQKDIGNSNPLIRALALRVLSSIRLKVIGQIVLICVKKAATDPSPYVRKTAAHAIPKLFSLDPEQQESLESIIAVLLADRHTMVLGSAVAAFLEVCPRRYDLIHPNYRKIVQVLADVDEWGQVMIITMLTHYCRTQFINPDKKEEARIASGKAATFYDDDDDPNAESYEEDPDLRLVLRATSPLLHSRNTAVVMAVATLWYYVAPSIERERCGRSLIRISRGSREIQYLVLSNIASMAAKRPTMFQSYITDFFVDASDPSWTRDLKLEILTLLASESNISKVLRELNHYVHYEDKAFVTASINAIGRCAMRLPDVAESCMHGLMALLSSKTETVVAEAIVVVKQLLQMGGDMHSHIVPQLARLLPTISHAGARASILWAVGEYSQLETVRLVAPDILRVLASSFATESDETKLQAVNLGAKLYITNPAQTQQLFQYVLQLAKYDRNYDLRDRARMIRLMTIDNPNGISAHAMSLFFSTKPAPLISNPSDHRSRFVLNTISHVLGHTMPGYAPLPDWPSVQPDKTVRNVAIVSSNAPAVGNGGYKSAYETVESFYADGEEGEGTYEEYYEEYVEGDEGEETAAGAEGEEGEEEWEYEYEEEAEDDPFGGFGATTASFSTPTASPAPAATRQPVATRPAAAASAAAPSPAPVDPFSSFGSSASMSFGGGVASPAASFGSPAATPSPTFGASSGSRAPATAPPASSAMADLLSLDFSSTSFGSAPVLAPDARPAALQMLLKEHMGGGLEVTYTYSRQPSVYGANYVSLDVHLRNTTDRALTGIRLGAVEGVTLVPFPEIPTLPAATIADTKLHLSFQSPTSVARIELHHSHAKYTMSLPAAPGELLHPATMTIDEFAEASASYAGMSSQSTSVTLNQSQRENVANSVLAVANVALVSNDPDTYTSSYSGIISANEKPLLISVDAHNVSDVQITVSSDDAVLPSTLLPVLKKQLMSA